MDADLDPEPVPRAASRAASRAPSRDAAAKGAAHVVGGLLLGAALACLVRFFVPLGPVQPLMALALAAICVSASRLAARHERDERAQAAHAAGLVLAGAIPFFAFSSAGVSAVGALLVIVSTLWSGARSPLALAGVVAFFTSARHATQVDLLAHEGVRSAAAFMLALLAYGALLLALPRGAWRSRATAATGAGVLLAAFPLLDALGATDAGVGALGIGALLATLFAIGMALDERPLAALSGGLLACAAVAFAFLALGPALAAIVLLLAGAATIWQAEAPGLGRLFSRRAS